MVNLLVLMVGFVLAGCASSVQPPSEPLSANRQAIGYELPDGEMVHWGDVRVNNDPGNGNRPPRDYSDRSTAR